MGGVRTGLLNLTSVITVHKMLLLVFRYIRIYHILHFDRDQKMINEPAHDKTYNTTCATSEDTDQPVHPRSMIRVPLIACAFYSL